jgi:hypothetical protein
LLHGRIIRIGVRTSWIVRTSWWVNLGWSTPESEVTSVGKVTGIWVDIRHYWWR